MQGSCHEMPFHAEQQARQPSCLLTSSSDALSDEEGALGSSSSSRRCLRLAQQAFGNNRKPLFQYMRQEPGSHISFIKRGFHPPPPGSGGLQTHLLPSTAPREASRWACHAPFTLGCPCEWGLASAVPSTLAPDSWKYALPGKPGCHRQ